MLKSQKIKLEGANTNMEDTISTLPILPHEVIMEILSYLPANHLWSFRSVSKTWFQLLTADPQFANLHFERSTQTNTPPSLLAKCENNSCFLAAQYTDLEKPVQVKLPNCYTISGVCNGLVCLSDTLQNEIYICNPLTRDYVTISYTSIPACILSHGRHMKNEMFAFGFHGCTYQTYQYKILRLSGEFDYIARNYHLKLSVYTLGVDSYWRTVEEDIHYHFSFESVNNRLVNGALHWLAASTGNSTHNVIVGFDVKDEVLRYMLPPTNVDCDDLSSQIVEFDGLLCFSTHNWVYNAFQIWLMKEYGLVDSWTKHLSIIIPELCQYLIQKPLGTYNGETLLKENSGKLILYNPRMNSIRYLVRVRLRDAYSYIGSIHSPRFICGVGTS